MQQATRFRYYIGAPATREAVAEFTALRLDGATVTEGIGIWKSTCESAVIVEVILFNDEAPAFAADYAYAINLFAGALRREFKQDAVLFTRETITAELEVG